MILDRAIMIGMALLLAMMGGYAFTEHRKAVKYSIDIQNKDDAIIAYEQLLKVVPFNSLTSERKDKADESINHIINSDNSIVDGKHGL